jgi:hypothetical protein
MKKLDDIPKKGIYDVPDGYFDTLPGIIQARVVAEKPALEPRHDFRYALQFALPTVLLLVVTIFVVREFQPETAEELLASVSTEELVSYLDESDVATEELMEDMDLDEATVEAIELEVYGNLFSDDLLEDVEFELDN